MKLQGKSTFKVSSNSFFGIKSLEEEVRILDQVLKEYIGSSSKYLNFWDSLSSGNLYGKPTEKTS